MIAYLKYFFYLAWHWNIKLAYTIIFYEIKGERRYGIDTTGTYDLTTSVSKKDRKHASVYQPVNYYIGEWLFSQLDTNDIEGVSFMDAGCGKGRAMVMAAYHGLNKVIGFDISPRLCAQTVATIEKVEMRYPDVTFEVECKDARDVIIPNDLGVLFLFNPFNKV
ncbi:MAG TPA: class I SAM-dependent methyltransferase, partial [Phnomibacter sp.]|nr:class I SAM-dependent methyltransferase [Phnomibacter sp.]